MINATKPGDLEVHATLVCLGIVWHIQSDANENCRVDVQYRAGSEQEWKDALPFVRVENRVHGVPDSPNDPITAPRGSMKGSATMLWNLRADVPEVHYGNLLAGSIFHLEPDTEYEVKLRLFDPDGGEAQRVLSPRTRREPRAHTEDRLIHVAPGKGIVWHKRRTKSTEEIPFSNLETAEHYARPGDTILLHEGTYPELRLRRRGTDDRPIVWRGVNREKVILNGGVNAEWARHVILENLTIRDDTTCVRADSFCHRYLPRDILVKCGAIYTGEIESLDGLQ